MKAWHVTKLKGVSFRSSHYRYPQTLSASLYDSDSEASKAGSGRRQHVRAFHHGKETAVKWSQARLFHASLPCAALCMLCFCACLVKVCVGGQCYWSSAHILGWLFVRKPLTSDTVLKQKSPLVVGNVLTATGCKKSEGPLRQSQHHRLQRRWRWCHNQQTQIWTWNDQQLSANAEGALTSLDLHAFICESDYDS